MAGRAMIDFAAHRLVEMLHGRSATARRAEQQRAEVDTGCSFPEKQQPSDTDSDARCWSNAGVSVGVIHAPAWWWSETERGFE